jgi:GH15 family glucan-1,4-alpha-glucosidase
MMALRIEDYALIGDCESAALVGIDGSIDWLCWPRFDSPACFAALLGEPRHGRWLLAPAEGAVRVTRRYRGDTLILETDFETSAGSVRIVDFMPIRGQAADIVRRVSGLTGQVTMRMSLSPRFDYGQLAPWIVRTDDGRLQAIAGPDRLDLCSDVPVRPEDGDILAEFEIGPGQSASFVLTHTPSYAAPPARHGAAEEDAGCETFWNDWSSRCRYAGPWRDALMRSHIVLKALTYRPTGGIVAAPTASLPEAIGGQRNWDYRFCWLRDATFTLMALMHAGYWDEARAWRDWLLRAVAGSPDKMQIMYGLAGERRLVEWQADWLSGYEDSRPVRFGNAAHGQLQLDVYGEVSDALYQARRHMGASPTSWDMQTALLTRLEELWHLPDHGIWEMRGPPRPLTYSKVMAWVAFDRAIRLVEACGAAGPVDRWRAQRRAIHEEVCARGFDPGQGSFVQAYGARALDASALLIPQVGFLPPDDPRVVATVEAIGRRLMVDGLVRRYDPDQTDDGVPGGEAVFLACSFWMVDALLLIGRRPEAERLFQRLIGLRNDVGLLAEEYDTVAGRMLGNFPQAFTHVALANTIRGLAATTKPPSRADGP